MNLNITLIGSLMGSQLASVKWSEEVAESNCIITVSRSPSKEAYTLWNGMCGEGRLVAIPYEDGTCTLKVAFEKLGHSYSQGKMVKLIGDSKLSGQLCEDNTKWGALEISMATIPAAVIFLLSVPTIIL